ncbi:MAG TPA: prepilin-type N-terminal cleavage/methylation domain-containing protein [Gemmatimonadales bacterium]|nr:prepilin-type N-terminal cleavage/methylation domain-containing protein [Gemmatimonadales bacterium]
MTPRSEHNNAGRHARAGFTLIELLIVVVIIGVLASIAIPKFSATKEKAYLAKMKGDLRNLMTAQEGYSADNFAYYGGAVPSLALAYNPSGGVVITIVQAVPGGWSATAAMPALTGKTCAVFTGTAAPVAPATADGIITCT